MNREILFRGKRTDNGEWVEGYYVPCTFGNWPCRPAIVDKADIENGMWHYDEVDPKTVGQFTGLDDKNGVKIFEGDIIEAQTQDTKQLRNAEVRFGEFTDINSDEDECYIGFYIVFDGIVTTAGQLKTCSDFIKVIDNIFDNPELLEDKP